MDLDAIWDDEWVDGVEIVKGERVVLEVNVWHPIVTNGDFVAYSVPFRMATHLFLNYLGFLVSSSKQDCNKHNPDSVCGFVFV